jgi:FkbM family methyltransferase
MSLKDFYGELPYFFRAIANSFKELKYAWQMAFFNSKTFKINDIILSMDRKLISKNIQKSIFKKNYEAGEHFIIKKILRPGDKLLEIGTGLGYNSITAAKIIGDHQVRTYEGNPQLIELIKENFLLNGVKIELMNKILTNDKKNEELKFYISENFWESSLSENQSKTFVMVKTSDFCEELNSFQPNTILCDIEGGEVELFLIQFPPFVKKIILDTHPFFSEIGNSRNSHLIAHILNQGFVLNSTVNYGFVYYFERN